MPRTADSPQMTSTTAFDPASATIAIVTYNRSGLLTRLLESITRMDPKPGHVVIIDNASVDDTTELVGDPKERAARARGDRLG